MASEPPPQVGSQPVILLVGDTGGGRSDEALRTMLGTEPRVARLVAAHELESGIGPDVGMWEDQSTADEESAPPPLGSLVRLLRAASADLVVAQVGACVGPEWYDGLRATAYADSMTATASAMPVIRLGTSGDEHEFTDAVEHSSPIATPIWGCVYIRLDALELAIGMVDNSVDGLDVEAALEAALVRPGFTHRLAATPVVVAGRSAEDVRRVVAPHPRARRALDLVEVGQRPLRVLVDGRCLAVPMSGTQVNVLSLVHSLAARADLSLALWLPENVHPSLVGEIGRVPRSVERQIDGQQIRRPDVFHRPYQLLFDRELGEVLGIGDRLVITQQDLISTRTPAYFTSRDLWRRAAARTHLSLLAADHIAFFSEHSRRQALDELWLSLERTSVIPLGTEHLDDFRDRDDLDEQPAGIEKGTPYLLVLGNAYAHKNRVFALRLFARLIRNHGWKGTLVMAGGHPPAGGSVGDERAYLLRHRELRDRVVDIGPVTEAEKRWLYRNAALALYPTLYEGFGLVPFEAAALGTPAVYSSRSSLGEFLPSDGALLDGWHIENIAAQLFELLTDKQRGERLVGALRRAAEPLTWRRTADAYADVYRRVMSPPVGVSLVIGDHFTIEPREAAAASRDEQRLLTLHRRSAAFRLASSGLFSVGRFARRAGKALQRRALRPS